jgi:hypothetical protein
MICVYILMYTDGKNIIERDFKYTNSCVLFGGNSLTHALKHGGRD